MRRVAESRRKTSPPGPSLAANRRAVLCLALALLAPPVAAADDAPTRWYAGAYSFSDEMGGFTIESVSGSGTSDDPFVIRETLSSSSAMTLVIRAERPIQPFAAGTAFANGVLHMRIDARNGSGQGWVEFEFELQEILHQPSTFGDGLSFDQRDARQSNIASDSFAEFSRDFEPFDKVLFRRGKVDPAQRAGFSFLVVDFTPKLEFYLVQDPRIPST